MLLKIPEAVVETTIPADTGTTGTGATGGTPGGGTTVMEKTYTVKAGDTLSGIALKFGTTYGLIAQLNGIAPPYIIHPGQVLKIP
jgi:LysM repeat protein